MLDRDIAYEDPGHYYKKSGFSSSKYQPFFCFLREKVNKIERR
jgi:hypothetical protein